MTKENSIKLLQKPKILNKRYLIPVILIVLGIAALATAGYFQFQKTPERVIQKMFREMEEVKNCHYLADLKINSRVPPTDILGEGLLEEAKEIKIALNLEGDLDISDLQNPQSSFLFDFQITAEPLFLQLAMEGREIKQDLYFKLKKVPDLGFLDLSQFEEQWIKVGSEILGTQELFDNEKIKESELEELVKNKDFFIIKEVLEDEIINDQKTYHYKFILDKKEIKNFIIEAASILQEKEFSQEELRELDNLIERLDQIEGELWMGKKDYLLYKIKVFANFVEQEEESEGNFVFSLALSGFNQPKNIEEPKDFKSIEEIFGNFSEIFKELPIPIPQQ